MSLVEDISSITEMESTLSAARAEAERNPTVENITHYHDLLIAWRRHDWAITRALTSLTQIANTRNFQTSYPVFHPIQAVNPHALVESDFSEPLDQRDWVTNVWSNLSIIDNKLQLASSVRAIAVDSRLYGHFEVSAKWGQAPAAGAAESLGWEYPGAAQCVCVEIDGTNFRFTSTVWNTETNAALAWNDGYKNAYHLYTIVREPESVKLYIDYVLKATITTNLPEFPLFPLLRNEDSTPTILYVDYFRIYGTGGETSILVDIRTDIALMKADIDNMAKALDDVGTKHLLAQLYDGTNKLNIISDGDGFSGTTQSVPVVGLGRQSLQAIALPVAFYNDALTYLAERGVPVFNVTTERKEGTKITDTSGDPALLETDDGEIAEGQKTLLVINLNMVHDGAKWVPMTQP